MAKDTPRDKCWKVALARCHRNDGEMTAERLAEITGVSERTARDVLKTMVGADILSQEGTEYVASDVAWTPYEERPEVEPH